MRSSKHIKTLIRNTKIHSNPEVNRAVLKDLLKQIDYAETQKPPDLLPNIRRTIMNNPITKIAVAAVIIALVILGLFELINKDSISGVVWADVARKVEASRGSVVRCRESFLSNEGNYTMKYYSPTQSRTDHYEAGHITYSYYEDFVKMTITAVFHPHKHYITDILNDSGPDIFLEQHEHWINPRYLVQRMLFGEHRNLGQKTIEGILCEGIETTDPASLGLLPGPINHLEVEFQLWVDVETKYPVLFEGKMSGEAEGEWMESEWVMDQFQWDVELDPNFLEPNIPPDYVDMRTL
jgi:hypothetical protein